MVINQRLTIDGKDHGLSDRQDNFGIFVQQLSEHDIPDHDILAYWDNHYTVQTAIYEHSQWANRSK